MNDFIKKIRTVFLDFLFPQENPEIFFPEQSLVNLKRPESPDKNIVALFDYKEELPKRLIWEVKYKNNEKAAKTLAESMYSQLLEILNEWITFEYFIDPILIPVPLSSEKLEKRGYNQTEMIAQKIIEIDNGSNLILETEVLKKIKDTQDQSSLKTKSERAKNLKNCFFVLEPEKIKGRNIIIVDDVLTTGATIKEVRKTLKQAGAKKIKAIVVAH